MTNPFAILGLPESLLLDPAAIESSWREHHRDNEAPSAGDASDHNRARAQRRALGAFGGHFFHHASHHHLQTATRA